MATANKDLYDFNPSPFSHRYFGVSELGELFCEREFACEFFGYLPVSGVSARQRMLRPIKAFAARTGLMPKTMAGKKLLKRLVFGSMVKMPVEISASDIDYEPPERVGSRQPNRGYKVIYLAARKKA